MIDRQTVEAIYRQPLKDLLFEAARTHSLHHANNNVQLSTLLSIKTGGCPENCAYCPQSAHYQTGLDRKKLMALEEVKDAAIAAKKNGSTRFCMGAAWREIRDGEEFESVLSMVREVKALGLEVCCTLGMLNASQAMRLKEAGLYAYNHNIDSSRNYYSKIISTRTYDDRLQTIENVRLAGLTVCTGGIIGMGESEDDRIDFVQQLALFDPPPESVTVNSLIPIEGTPLAKQNSANAFDLARVIATIRCLIPKAMIRLSAGRKTLTPEGQFLCFMAGANSIFYGNTLLTAENPSISDDEAFLSSTGLTPQTNEARL